MQRIPFVKVEGLGNDFIVVDLRPGRPAAAIRPAPSQPEVAKAMCDRHFGVGADGVLAILPGDQGDARMRVINSDGSEPEMCGNGIRCVAKVLYESDPALRKPALNIDTGAGLLSCELDVSDGRVSAVAVQMGRPKLLRGEIPLAGPATDRALRTTVRALDRSFTFTGVSMGNPHAVIFVEDASADLRALATTFGPVIENDPLFPRRTNVEFARIRSGAKPEIDLVVWERGAGLTLACGTGACATVVAACLEGRLQPGHELSVHLPGGTMFITVAPETTGAEPTYAGVKMRGPARIVFEGEFATS